MSRYDSTALVKQRFILCREYTRTQLHAGALYSSGVRGGGHEKLLFCQCNVSKHAFAINALCNFSSTLTSAIRAFMPCRVLVLPDTFPAELASLHCGGNTIAPSLGSASIVIPDGSNISLEQCQLPCISDRPETLTAAACSLRGLPQPAQLMHGMFCVPPTATLTLQNCTYSCSASVRAATA